MSNAAALSAVLALAGCARTSTPPRSPSSHEGVDSATSEAHLTSADAAPQEAQPRTGETAASKDEGRSTRTLGFIILGVGASVTAVALGTSAIMLHENGVRSDGCNAQKVCSPAGLAANSKLDALGGWNAGLWAVGAAGLGIGAFLVVTHPAKNSGHTTVGVAPNGSGMDLALRGTF
jgi:hypothetical protein